MSNKRRTKDGKVILSDQGGKYTVEYGKDAIPYEEVKLEKDESIMKKLLEELAFQVKMFENEMIDKDDFVQAINEIHEHYHDQMIYSKIGKPPRYTKTYSGALKWFKKS